VAELGIQSFAERIYSGKRLSFNRYQKSRKFIETKIAATKL